MALSQPCSSAVRLSSRRQDTAADLVALDRFEERAEIALAKAFVALALDDLEEDRADDGLGEDLQQEPLPLRRRAVDQDLVAPETREVLAMAGQPRIDRLVIGLRHRHECDATAAKRLHGLVDVGAGE